MPESEGVVAKTQAGTASASVLDDPEMILSEMDPGDSHLGI